LERPGLVRSLTLVNALPSGFVFQGTMPPELLEMMSAVARGDTAAASELQIRIWFDGPARTTSSLSSAKLEARAEAARMNRRFVERGTFGIADAVPKDPLTPPAIARLGEIHVPTLVVSGALDYAENRRAPKLLTDGIPDARLVIMNDCAHVPPLEDPASFATILTSFIEEIGEDQHRLP
jgi:pimeloyl-ACP methyl ester carboxylesterase